MKYPILATLAAGLALAGHVSAAAVVSSNAVFNTATSNYTYSYSVMNTGMMDDLVIVSIPAFSPLGVSSIMAPSGFSLTFDMVGGWINLIEDGSIITPETFAPGSTAGTFSFNSAAAPGTVNFVAYDAGGAEFMGTAMAPVPEVSASLLVLLTGLAASVRRRRDPAI